MERVEAYKIAQKCAQLLKEQFKVNNVYIFGSVAGDGLWHKWSDIDIAVEGLPSQDYFKALTAVDKILPSELELDLVTLESATEKLKERVKYLSDDVDGDVLMKENRTDRLEWLLKTELEEMEKVVEELNDNLKEISEQPKQPTVSELRILGSCLHDFYCGAERIFERIIIELDNELPEGKEWHTLLLQNIEAKSIIDHQLSLRLLDYLKFRHLFRNSYGSKLDWDRLSRLAYGVSDTLKLLREQITMFLENYSSKS
jgi:predicted nucleotidyltransferase